MEWPSVSSRIRSLVWLSSGLLLLLAYLFAQAGARAMAGVLAGAAVLAWIVVSVVRTRAASRDEGSFEARAALGLIGAGFLTLAVILGWELLHGGAISFCENRTDEACWTDPSREVALPEWIAGGVTLVFAGIGIACVAIALSTDPLELPGNEPEGR